MRVLFVSSGKKNGEPSAIVKAQATSLINEGVSVGQFTILKKGIKGYLHEAKRLRRHLKTNKYDIIHAHYGFSGIVGLLAKKREKLVVSFMGDDIVGSNNSDGSVSYKSRIIAFVNNLVSWLFYNYNIVKSKEMHKRIYSRKVDIIPNGVNLSMFYVKEKAAARKELGINLEKKIAIFVSDPERVEKNYKLAKDVINEVKRHVDIELISVYNRPQKDLNNFYNAADLLIMTSYHEGSPNVVKEAMACSCPLVCTDVGDVEWIIYNTKGCLLASYDIASYAEKVFQVLKYAENKNRTNGRERLQSINLDAKSVAERILDIYKNLM
jgi:glycosyltransferase involved in cell wall biosynthesis